MGFERGQRELMGNHCGTAGSLLTRSLREPMGRFGSPRTALSHSSSPELSQRALSLGKQPATHSQPRAVQLRSVSNPELIQTAVE